MSNNKKMYIKLPHENLDVYKLYLEAASLCGEVLTNAIRKIVALDHLERAMESIGINLIRANGQLAGSDGRANCLDISMASTNECAASLDVCLAKGVVDESLYTVGMEKFWRIRGMLYGLKRSSIEQAREARVLYGPPRFSFANLDMYRVSLEGVRWVDEFLKELAPSRRTQRRLDKSTTGTVLNIAEGHGRQTVTDQNRFMNTAQDHAYQTLLMLDLTAAKKKTLQYRIEEGKTKQSRIITMLHAWCEQNEKRNKSQR